MDPHAVSTVENLGTTVLGALLAPALLAGCGSDGLGGRPEDPRRRHPRQLGDAEGGAREVQGRDRHHRQGAAAG